MIRVLRWTLVAVIGAGWFFVGYVIAGWSVVMFLLVFVLIAGHQWSKRR